MAILRIDQLPPILAAALTNEIAMIEGGVTGKMTIQQLQTLVAAAIIGTAPSTLDTLGEIATALSNDASAFDTLSDLIAEKLPLAGGTMTGALNMDGQQISNVSTINGGPLTGFRNRIINGNFDISQRNNATMTPGVGVYGYDRWKGHANGLEQVVEGLPAGTYTLTFGGGGTGSVDGSAPASSPHLVTVASTGDISVVVPDTATNVSLVAGDARQEADPFEYRPRQIEETLCYRYYYGEVAVGGSGYSNVVSSPDRVLMSVHFPVQMRVTPSRSFTATHNVSVNANPFAGVLSATERYCVFSPISNAAGAPTVWRGSVTFNAEF